MQDHSPSGVATATEDDAQVWTPTLRRRVLLALISALCILLLVVVPPSLSINRYQRRVATAISGALGRPVHFDSITLRLLPVPGLTINNFVVSESPDFGYEPVLRANTVEARLRVSSLWRRRIEVSRISLDAPSINLVRRPEDGRWNLQSILMQASQLRSAPTAQQRAGDAPRFPYIEATDARINIKNGDNKLPFSVKEAEFALWLPEPEQWRLRVVGKPVRTDTDVSDVGLLRVEGTLGRATDLGNAPIDLQVGWKPTPLGEAAKLTAGYDLGWRGEVAATASLRGTLGAGKLVTDVHLHSLHRADFLPEHNAEVDAHCEAATAGLLRSLNDIRCAIPTDTSLSFASVMDALRSMPMLSDADPDTVDQAKPGVLLLRAEVPNLLDWQTVSGSATLNDAPAGYVMTWAELFTRSFAPALSMDGRVDLAATLQAGGAAGSRWSGSLRCICTLPRPATTSVAPVAATGPNQWVMLFDLKAAQPGTTGHQLTVQAAPVPPAQAQKADTPQQAAALLPSEFAPVQGTLTQDGYDLHYDTMADVMQAALLVPRLGEGLEATAVAPFEAQSGWHTMQGWTNHAATPPPPLVRKKHRRR